MMHMTLYWGKQVTLLFDSWGTNSWLSYFLTLLACFLFASFYQYMEDRRIRFKSFTFTNLIFAATTLLPKTRRFKPAKVVSAVLLVVNSVIGYLLMLAIMSLNGGMFLAIVARLTVGYLFFQCEDEGVCGR
ncbi:hypothetical protein SLA2020_502050 [Shorea laevis]